jgi:hypothetical protein
MATKVKGEAIKEGSIPLSALSNEVKDKIENAGGSADWNAQKGEAGYIKNKPFNNKYSLVWTYEAEGIFADEDNQDYEARNLMNYGLMEGSIILNISENSSWFPKGNVKLTRNEPISLSYNDEYFGSITIFNSGILISADFVDVPGEAISDIKIIDLINSRDISDTVLKTTPQTLSNDAKNQALANLGIDPIVWKYMMNPITIINGESVPQDIIDIYPNTLPIICFSATTNGGEWSWGTPVWIDSYNGVAFNFTDEGYYIARIVNGLWSLEEY